MKGFETKYFRRYEMLFLVFVGFCILVEPSHSQTVEIIGQRGENYHIQIDGKDYLAFPEETAKKILVKFDSLKIELEAARKQLAGKDTLINALEKTRETYAKNFSIQDALIEQTKSLYEGYRDLYFDYKKAYSEPWLYFSGGIGAVRERGGDNDVLPVILLGLSIRRLSLWGFINNDQSGFILGINHPIRFSLF